VVSQQHAAGQLGAVKQSVFRRWLPGFAVVSAAEARAEAPSLPQDFDRGNSSMVGVKGGIGAVAPVVGVWVSVSGCEDEWV
jgi:hypothetical protein